MSAPPNHHRSFSSIFIEIMSKVLIQFDDGKLRSVACSADSLTYSNAVRSVLLLAFGDATSNRTHRTAYYYTMVNPQMEHTRSDRRAVSLQVLFM
jgi:hypothetical protein